MTIRHASGVVLLDEEGKKVLLVTSLKLPGMWVFPKGGVEPNLTPEENAQKEMREEAGIAVQLHECVYDLDVQYAATEKLPARIQHETYFRGTFLSYVDWEEFQLRKREWFEINEAAQMLPPHQIDVLRAAVESRSEALNTAGL